MSISGSVLRDRAVLLIYLRAVSNSYFTVHCFNSESVFQPLVTPSKRHWRVTSCQKFASRQLSGMHLYYSKLGCVSEQPITSLTSSSPSHLAGLQCHLFWSLGIRLIMSWSFLERVAFLVGGNGNWGHLKSRHYASPVGHMFPRDRAPSQDKQEASAVGRMAFLHYDNVNDL